MCNASRNEEGIKSFGVIWSVTFLISKRFPNSKASHAEWPPFSRKSLLKGVTLLIIMKSIYLLLKKALPAS